MQGHNQWLIKVFGVLWYTKCIMQTRLQVPGWVSSCSTVRWKINAKSAVLYVVELYAVFSNENCAETQCCVA
jgi:hypothetical protein